MIFLTDRVFSEIEILKEEYLSFWENVCNIESPTFCKSGVDAVGEYFSHWAENNGFYVEKHGEVICDL